MPTSKAFRQWLERTPPRHQVLVDPDSDWADPTAGATWILRCDPAALGHAVVRRNGTTRLAAHGGNGSTLGDMDATVAARVAARLDAAPFCEPVAVRALARALPDGALLWVGNSMPVRDLDAWLAPDDRALRILGNRGANGIDGTLSSALGAAAVHGGPAVLLCGDLALLHDLGGLLSASRFALPLVIAVLDNGGGGIFSMLPVAERIDGAEFDRFFRTPHGLDLERAGELFGLCARRVGDEPTLVAALDEALVSGGPSLLVIGVDADAGWAARRAAVAAAGEAP
jgi:2-succinyl-5-enolpyruvyl-6-hydroxy-3-cyclohexene-1-carboxylate synthase